MSENYLCPNCGESLFKSKEQKLVLFGILKADLFEVESIFELNHQKNNFGGKALAENIKVQNGALVNFYCPHCKFDLTAPYDKELCEFIYVNEEGEKNAFIISKIAGKEMAFLVCKDRKEILESYGKDKDNILKDFYHYFNIWGRF